MDMAFVQQVILPVVYVAVGIALIWALVELILFIRRTSKTVSNVEEQVQPILADAKAMTEDLKPAIEKIDPLLDRASLAVDAANLEIMRIDGILEDISTITDTAVRVVEVADTAAQTPMRLVTEVSNKLRQTFGSKDASQKSAALGATGEANMAALHEPAIKDAVDAGAAPENEPTYTVAAPSVEAAMDTHATADALDADEKAFSQPENPAEKVAESKPKSKYFTY